jgi:hypothetical protein
MTFPPLLVSVALFAYSLDYLFTRVSPSEDLMNQYDDTSGESQDTSTATGWTAW